MDRPNTSSEGSLYELVARGQKDQFFISQEKTAAVPFSYNMGTWPATINETRQTQPLSQVDFGRTVEWELEVFGDFLVSAALVVDLPSWLPIEFQALNGSSIIEASDATRYGYTNGIAAFLFEKIQFYQDQLLIQEFTGDFLYAWTHLQSTLNQEALALKELGAHTGSSLEIQRNATPGRLYLRLPLVGCSHPDDGGLPFVAIPGQKFRLRCTLRKLEDLVESSPPAVKPAPWGRSDFKSIEPGFEQPIRTLTREKIGKPLITLETTQRYIRQDYQKQVKKTQNIIPFIRPFENTLSLDPADYVSVGNGGASYVTKRIDGRHPAEGILVFFQSDYDIERNRLWSFSNPRDGNEYYNTMKLIVAGKDREKEWSPMVWDHLSPFVKSEKVPGTTMAWLSFTVGPSYGYRAPEKRKPSGTLNFSMADRPTLWLDIRDTLKSVTTNQKRVTMRAITVGWGLYNVEEERGGLLFAN